LYKIIELETHSDERGQLIAIENCRNIPFDVKRVFCIFNIARDAKRAQHANMRSQEAILCLHGSCEIVLDNGRGSKVRLELNRKNEILCIEPEIWVELSHFSQNCVLMVMADNYYDRQEQIKDYNEFLRMQNDKVFGFV
jgi:dTDP-4-dehydrorhamnose 3,5-epimerase-like enzyme